MNAFYSLFLVFALVLIAVFGVGAGGLTSLFGVWIPYLALLAFLGGIAYKLIYWAKSPVPFRITTTAGQQKSLEIFKHNSLDNPTTTRGVVGRMMLEILAFRTLLRNTKSRVFIKDDGTPEVGYSGSQWLWFFALTFHYSFLIVVIRHLRLFLDPVPVPIVWLEWLDGILQVTQPSLYLTDIGILLGLTYLFLRRVLSPQMRYLSNAADYFPLFLLLAIAISGIYMRYVARVDIADIKTLTMGIATFSPTIPAGIDLSFYVHLFLVSTLLIYFPVSKLMHLGGVFLTPTRVYANNTRMKHHENPWNNKVPPHSYEAYEDDFRAPMAEAGLPLEKQPENAEG